MCGGIDDGYSDGIEMNTMGINYIKTLVEMSDEALAAELEHAPIKRIREKLRLALMQQDRDTRQACAGSVDKIKYFIAFESYDGNVLRSRGCLIADCDADKDIETFLKDCAESYRAKANIIKSNNIITTAFNRL